MNKIIIIIIIIIIINYVFVFSSITTIQSSNSIARFKPIWYD